MYVRGKPCTVSKHAVDGMRSERRPIDYAELGLVLEEPDSDDGRLARKRIRARTILVYYTEYDDEVYVRAVSATRARFPT